MYVNVDSALLWLKLLDKYLVNGCNLKMINADSCILFRKDDKGNLELVMSFHVDNVFMASKPETLNNTRENIKEKFNIKKFLRVYYEWGHDVKGTYAK